MACSLHRREKGAIACRMAGGGALSEAGERWLMRISLLGKGRVPSGPGLIGKTSASPRETSPWNIRMVTLPGAAEEEAPAASGGGRSIAMGGIGGAGDWEERGMERGREHAQG